MAIYKLGDIASVQMCKRIMSYETLSQGEVPFYKIGTLGGKPDAFISKKMFEDYSNSYRFPEKGDSLITCSGTIGKVIKYDGKPAYFQDSNIIWLKTDKILKDYLYFWLLKEPFNATGGSTIKRLYNSDVLSTKINVPTLIEQQKIINIIELHEKLFLRYPECIRMDSSKNVSNDMKNLINIIEPVETLINKVDQVKFDILKIFSYFANNKLTNTNNKLISYVTFEKGKNKTGNFINCGTPFLDVRTLNSRVPSKFVKEKNNTFKGDILLSLDATVGIHDYFLEGFNGYLYNLKSLKISKVEILLNLINNKNQQIIKNNAIGSTIKHASRAKNELLYFKLPNFLKNNFIRLFDFLLLCENILEKLNLVKNEAIKLLIK